MSQLPVEQVLLDAVSVIERLNVPYAIMGGFGARAWGLPRPTFDADFAVDVETQAGFDVPTAQRAGVLDVIAGFKKAKINRVVDGHVGETDLFVVHGEFMRSALARAREETTASRRVRVMAPEDIILLKLIANRRKDLADVEEITAICKDLDVAYLWEWAVKLGLSERLSDFL